jgi:hypothetical protein
MAAKQMIGALQTISNATIVCVCPEHSIIPDATSKSARDAMGKH